MAFKLRIIFISLIVFVSGKEDLKDFEFESDPDEVMIAQESRQYQTVVKPPVRIVKPTGVTNSHRPQYNLDSFETKDVLEDFFEATTKRSIAKHYKSSNKIRAKEGMVKDAVLRALERKDHVGKFAQILPIIRAMSGSQRVALASLVASQVSTPPGRAPLNLAQVRSMFGSNVNASAELMLPILLDMANLIRRAVRSGKEPREVRQPPPQAQLLRRSFTEDEDSILDDELFETGIEPTTTTKAPRSRNRRIPQRYTKTNKTTQNIVQDNKTDFVDTSHNFTKDTINLINITESDRNISRTTTESTSSSTSPMMKAKPSNVPRSLDNGTLDLMADSTNQTLAQDLPVAEKLRNLNRYIDRKGNLIRRGTYPPKPPAIRTTAEPTVSTIRRRPPPVKKLPANQPVQEKSKCELFTNSLCLHSEDYPADAILQSIRRNKAAAGALLADYRDPGEGALDGVTAAQEAKYTAEHYLVSNRRGDTLNRDFASAGEAGFMCPSTVKYARPQRARATSGQWKYIVNTGEHTQTLRLEKCLKPKESCTYLTDNFKSKCVQVYNYHRLLTWDQQNGLHMDIFKVPTCCSCHIEGYSVSFPPLGQRIHETSSEHFPGEDLSSEHGNGAFESVQSSIQRPNLIKNLPFSHNKPLESFPPFSDTHNLISGSPFGNSKHQDNDDANMPPSGPVDTFTNYFPDSFNQASSIRNVKRPPSARNPSNFDRVTLPSYLEPPTPEATSSFSFVKDLPSKIKMNGSQFKRGVSRPNRRPIRKKISGGLDDLVSSGSSAIESLTSSSVEEDFSEYLEDPDMGQASVSSQSKQRITIAPKLQAVTTEKTYSTIKPREKSQSLGQSFTSNGKRVNYNYHPIIDFFKNDEEKEDDESIDREDSESTYIPTIESEWKPMNNPPLRNTQSASLHGR